MHAQASLSIYMFVLKFYFRKTLCTASISSSIVIHKMYPRKILPSLHATMQFLCNCKSSNQTKPANQFRAYIVVKYTPKKK